jgi:hypothetical protein
VGDVVLQGVAHLGRALRPGADDELHADPPVVGRIGPAQRRREQGLQDLAHRRLAGVTVRGLMEHAGALAVQLSGPPAEDLEQQGVLGPEMVVHRGQVDARLGGDVAHRDVLEAVQGEQPLSGGEDGGLGRGVGFAVSFRGGFRRVDHGTGHANPSRNSATVSP